MPSLADIIPSFEIQSNLQNMPNLYDYDSEENIEINVNYKYGSVYELSTYHCKVNDLSIFHTNVTRLSVAS